MGFMQGQLGGQGRGAGLRLGAGLYLVTIKNCTWKPDGQYGSYYIFDLEVNASEAYPTNETFSSNVDLNVTPPGIASSVALNFADKYGFGKQEFVGILQDAFEGQSVTAEQMEAEGEAAAEGRENTLIGRQFGLQMIPSHPKNAGKDFLKKISFPASAYPAMAEALSGYVAPAASAPRAAVVPAAPVASAPVAPVASAPVAPVAPVDPEAALGAAGWTTNPNGPSWVYRTASPGDPQRDRAEVLGELGA